MIDKWVKSNIGTFYSNWGKKRFLAITVIVLGTNCKDSCCFQKQVMKTNKIRGNMHIMKKCQMP